MSDNGSVALIDAPIQFERLVLNPRIMALVAAGGDVLLAAERLEISPKDLYEEAMINMAMYNFLARGRALQALYRDIESKADSGTLEAGEVERLVALLEGRTPIHFHQTNNYESGSKSVGVTVLDWE